MKIIGLSKRKKKKKINIGYAHINLLIEMIYKFAFH